MADSGRELIGRILHPGSARGQLLVLGEPLSFWGGVDEDGRVIDPHHPQHGYQLRGMVVAMSSGRGSSSSSSVLADQIRAGTSPAALVLSECDAILVTGALVAAELYGRRMPIVELDPGDLATLVSGGVAEVDATEDSGVATVRVG